ncbi:MAG: hypothetical protein ACE5ED_05150 [Rhodothalassiaceae bacterium]
MRTIATLQQPDAGSIRFDGIFLVTFVSPFALKTLSRSMGLTYVSASSPSSCFTG